MMPRIFMPEQELEMGQVWMVDEAQAHHFVRVLRVRNGERLVAVVQGEPWLCEIDEAQQSPLRLTLRPISRYPGHEPHIRLTLVQGAAKGEKMDDIFQHMTELGVSHFIAYQTERSVIQLTKKRQEKRDRWQKIVNEAAAQSQRDIQPLVTVACSRNELEQQLPDRAEATCLVCDELPQGNSLGKAVEHELKSGKRHFVLFIGPEGGFSDAERQWFYHQLGAIGVQLGPRQLRTETAGLVAASIVLQLSGDLEGNL